jgi:RNA polymerase sigma-B factor
MFRRLKSLDEGSVAFRRQREAVVERCLPIADHIARRFSNRGEPLDDLVQAARVGLVNAVNRFDVETGSEFIAFAVPTMMGEVRCHFRDCGWAVKVPRRLKDLQGQLVKARGELSQGLVVERVGCSQMHVSRLLAQALRTLRSQVRAPELAVTA